MIILISVSLVLSCLFLKCTWPFLLYFSTMATIKNRVLLLLDDNKQTFAQNSAYKN